MADSTKNPNSHPGDGHAAQAKAMENLDEVQVETATGPVVDTSNDELNRLRDDLVEATNRALRAQADLENYRKRAQREMDEERKFANLPLLRDLLPVLDNIGRALGASEKTQDLQSLLTGFRMVNKQLEDVLARHGCVRIDALNQAFDPHLHEAISQQPSDEHPPHTVVAIGQEGYRLHERVIRPSHVVVSIAKEPQN